MASKIKVDNITDQDDNAVISRCGSTHTVTAEVYKADTIQDTSGNAYLAKCGTAITLGGGSDTTTVPGAAVVTGNVTGANLISSCNVVKSNEYQASDGGVIISQSGTAITIGASGDTVSLASGASQSGFGRSGSVDWETTAKTGDFTAANGEGYFVNTTSGEIIMTLPAGSAGAIVAAQDYNNTFDSNLFEIRAAGSDKINGGQDGGRIVLNTAGEGVTLVYVDATVGWRSIEQSVFTDQSVAAEYIVATGGTITTCGDFKVHRFTGPGTFTVCSAGNACGSEQVDYLVVAGGGGGAGRDVAGGAGAGGFRTSNFWGLPSPTTSPLANPTGVVVSAQGYPITVGGGGSGATCQTGPGNPGSNSTGVGITSSGGGGGTAFGSGQPGQPGGSGGGGGRCSPSNFGSGNSPPVSPPQGNPGGNGAPGSGNADGGGGGGGAGAGGSPGRPGTGNGGDGSYISPLFATPGEGTPGPVGSTRYFAGGGGGAQHRAQNPANPGDGGAGGGAPGAPSGPGPSGTTNTGGGGGASRGAPANGGSGGSGMVIIRYKFQN
jgi:hypothetical protein